MSYGREKERKQEKRKKKNEKRKKKEKKNLTAMPGTVDNSFELVDRNKIYTLRYQ
jgi:hypothetical protein